MSHTTDQPAVGYKNPPLHSRFQKGRSGNPSGRRKAKPQLNLLDEVAKLMAEPIPLVKKGKPQKVPFLEALLRKTAEQAFKGDAAARRDLIKLIEMQSARSDAGEGEAISHDQEAAILARYFERERRAGEGCDD